jgi:hypothetical protein
MATVVLMLPLVGMVLMLVLARSDQQPLGALITSGDIRRVADAGARL